MDREASSPGSIERDRTFAATLPGPGSFAVWNQRFGERSIERLMIEPRVMTFHRMRDLRILSEIRGIDYAFARVSILMGASRNACPIHVDRLGDPF
jgi:hypothetical protein